MQFGVAKIERPAILTEILHIGGWYIPGDKAGCVSDGTIAGQAGDDKKLLPMITTEALIIGDVEITATGWGASGQALSDHYENQKAQTDSSSWNAGGSVGFCGFGGSVDHSESEWSGSASNDANASWGFKYDAFSDKGTLTIKGRQVAGYVGEIVGMNPRIDDPNLGKDKDKPKAEGAAATSNGDAATPAPDGTAATPAADATGATTNGDPAATPTVPAGGQA
jgi:hypothetical protein